MKEEGPFLEDTGKGLTISFHGRHLYSNRNPGEKPRRLAESLRILPRTLVLVPSPLLLYGIPELLAGLPEDCHVLCIETEEPLMALSLKEVQAVIPPDSPLTLLRCGGADAVTRAVEELDPGRFRRVHLLTLNGGYNLHAAVYNAMHQAAEQAVQRYWQNRMTLVHMAPLWFKNLFRNLPLLPGSCRVPSGAMQAPVFFAGAGESIEGSAGFIRENRERLSLFCADTALPVLLALGLEPDAVVVLEAQVHNAADFIGGFRKSCLLFADLTSHPAIPRKFPGKTCFFSSDFAETALLARLKESNLIPWTIPSLGSVGVAGVYIAEKLTAGAVYISGLDFCYQRGKPHARGAPSHTLALAGNRRLEPSPLYARAAARTLISRKNKAGMGVYTDLVLNSYVENLNAVCRQSGRIFDVGTGGLPTSARVHDASGRVKENLADANISIPSVPVETTAPEVRLFLEDELGLIEKLLDLDHRSPEFPGLVRQLDYVCIHFPEFPRLDLKDTGMIKRIHQSASYYRAVLSKVLAS